MQIVIEIDNEHYERIMRFEEGVTVYPTTLALYEAVKDGTPLETAEWLEDSLTKFKVVCSKCGCRHFGADRKYCPRCGRKMEEDIQ